MRLNKNLNVSHVSDRYLIHKNFAGKTSQFNRNGTRLFDLCLDDPCAVYSYGDIVYDGKDEPGHAPLSQLPEDLKNDGWNVKVLPENKEKNYEERPFVKVTIKLDYGRTPKICKVNRANRAIKIENDSIEDFLDNIGSSNVIEWANISVTPFNWDWRDGGNRQSAEASVLYFKFFENDIWEEMYE